MFFAPNIFGKAHKFANILVGHVEFGHLGENRFLTQNAWKSHFSSASALKTRIWSRRSLRQGAMFKLIYMTRRAFCSVRVIRLQRAASWHVQNKWPFCNMKGGFSQISRDPQIHFWRDQFFQIAYQISRRMVWVPSPFNLIWCPGNWRTGARHETPRCPKSWKSWFSKRSGSQNGVFEPRGAALPRNV